MPDELEFDSLVTRFYGPLYQFAFGLTRAEADASDLTQQTFYIWATKGHQLRDRAKVKTWLFTTLHREFLNMRRKVQRFPHFQLEEVDQDLPAVVPEMVNHMDGARAVELLGEVGEPYRAALTLYYMEDCSYKDIAEILEVPLGTVQSRISRGVAQLHYLVVNRGGVRDPRAARREVNG